MNGWGGTSFSLAKPAMASVPSSGVTGGPSQPLVGRALIATPNHLRDWQQHWGHPLVVDSQPPQGVEKGVGPPTVRGIIRQFTPLLQPSSLIYRSMSYQKDGAPWGCPHWQSYPPESRVGSPKGVPHHRLKISHPRHRFFSSRGPAGRGAGVSLRAAILGHRTLARRRIGMDIISGKDL